jgi:hypothetical protein
MMFRHAGLALALALLAGCATPTAYMPAAKPGAMGYSETQIETDRYRITFKTAAGGARYAEDMALRRAAELTLAQGYDWFFVNNRFAETGRDSGPQFSVGGGFGSFGRHSSVGIGTSVGIPLAGPGPAADASLEIRLGKGPKPQDPAAYDAREIARSLAPRTPV